MLRHALPMLCASALCLVAADPLPLIPLPRKVVQQEGRLQIRAGAGLQGPAVAAKGMKALQERLAARGLAVGQGAVVFRFEKTAGLPEEGYRLAIHRKGVRIQASEPKGFFYAVQTLDQLMEAGTALPCVQIEDAPRFPWRALMLDVSRHFFTVEEVKALLDRMAELKLNTLHWHLTDDQGWRIEIKSRPELTAQGAWRDLNPHDDDCLKRAKEDPTFALPEDRFQVVNGKRQYGGFYTQAQIREVIAYAAARQITVIPEIDMPGHLKAALDAYPQLSCTGKAGWGKHFSLPACPTKEATYAFMQDVLGEVAALFPAKLIHIGGDEVNTDAWKDCPSCQAVMQKEGLKDLHALQARFNRRVQTFLASKGKEMAAWDEVAEAPLAPATSIFWWRNWAPKTLERASREAKNLIITPNFEYYFDFQHSQTPLEKVYTYEPVPAAFDASQRARVRGIQGNFWSEYIPSLARLQFMGFPRALALAERGWSAEDVKDFGHFQARLTPNLDRYARLKWHHHLPPLQGLTERAVFIDATAVDLKAPLPDQIITYTLDGTVPTESSPRWSGPLKIDRTCTLRARTFRKGIGSETFEGRFTQEAPRQPALPSETRLSPGLKRTKVAQRFELAKDVVIPAGSPSTVASVPAPESPRADNYGLVFEGHFFAPVTGVYSFTTHSDDGDVFFIGERLVVDNDGSHGEKPATGQIALAAGWHPVRHLYRQLGGGQALRLEIQRPGEASRPARGEDFGH